MRKVILYRSEIWGQYPIISFRIAESVKERYVSGGSCNLLDTPTVDVRYELIVPDYTVEGLRLIVSPGLSEDVLRILRNNKKPATIEVDEGLNGEPIIKVFAQLLTETGRKYEVQAKVLSRRLYAIHRPQIYRCDPYDELPLFKINEADFARFEVDLNFDMEMPEIEVDIEGVKFTPDLKHIYRLP